MFTGIIEEVGTIRSVRHGGKAVTLEVDACRVLDGTRKGDSICTDGVCLTVAGLKPSGFVAEVMPETMKRTTFHTLRPGSKVNLERALRLSDRLGGHLVAGHIDGTGRIVERRREENAEWFRIAAPREVLRYLVEKGSVALNGISLTVVTVDEHSFTVSLIPYTQAETTMMGKQAGSLINIECDIIGKYVEKLTKGGTGTQGINLETLARNGYI